MTTLSADARRAYEANIWKAYLFQFLHSFQLWWPVWVIYLTDLRGFSLTEVSVLETLFWVTIVLSEVPTGAVADRFGRKTSLVLAAVCVTAAVLVFGVATNFWVVLVSYVAWGFGLTFQSGADSALTYESLKALGREREYPRVAGVTWGLFSLGTLLGMLLGAPIAAATSLSVPVLMSAGIAFAGLLVALSFCEPPPEHGEERIAYGPLIAQSARTAWRTPPVRSMIVLSAILIAVVNPSGIFAQPFLEQHDVSVGLFGVAQAPMRIAGLIGAVAAYRISARFGTRGVFGAAPALIVGAYALLAGWDSVYAFGAVGVILFVNSGLLPLTADYLNQRIPNSQRATILSLRQLASSVVIAAFQPGMGTLADHASLSWAFWVSAAVTLAALPALWWWLHADRREEKPPQRIAAEAPAAVEALPGA
jgi:MFS family permease